MAQVTVAEGILEGEEVENKYGGKYYSFKGIPYAEPPVGELRFKAPQPLQPWEGVRNAKEHGPICYQYDIFFNSPEPGSEDCLYLNVYTPDLTPDSPLPVMFWIHGGGFVCGSGNSEFYGPEFLIRRDVILVTINYRLGALGFLCLDTEEIPGNAGMKDQVAALRWVKNNISNFGGDPENITIFGESAGACSVSFHLISPMSKGIFKRAIAQSGSANAWWSQPFEPRERAIAIAKKLGLDSEDDAELAEFFKSLPVESLVKTEVPITLAEKSAERINVQLSVVSEKDFGEERFFYGDVVDALTNGIHDEVEVMSGYCEDEGVLALGAANFEQVVCIANNFLEFYVPKSLTLNCSIKDQMEIGRRMKKFYFNNEKLSKGNVQHLIKFYGAEMFSIPITQLQRLISSKNTVYLYKFTCKSERNIMSRALHANELLDSRIVVSHGDDLSYVFPLDMEVEQDSKTYEMIENVVTLWTNFAKYGNPTPDDTLGVTWNPYNVETEDYLDIGEELVAGSAPDKEEFEFWEAIFSEYLPNN